MSAIQYLKNDDGIIILTLDSPNQSANTMNADFRVALENIVSKLKSETSITGIIFRSAKKTFFAGGDLDELIQARLEFWKRKKLTHLKTPDLVILDWSLPCNIS
jgi:3-hydroxyacyl-CoA dehydrogenase/enoyl-CoA hydratase/3-hydroxybutyryl-CoA epimerase